MGLLSQQPFSFSWEVVAFCECKVNALFSNHQIFLQFFALSRLIFLSLHLKIAFFRLFQRYNPLIDVLKALKALRVLIDIKALKN